MVKIIHNGSNDFLLVKILGNGMHLLNIDDIVSIRQNGMNCDISLGPESKVYSADCRMSDVIAAMQCRPSFGELMSLAVSAIEQIRINAEISEKLNSRDSLLKYMHEMYDRNIMDGLDKYAWLCSIINEIGELELHKIITEDDNV
jgi:hypothetical protein